MVKTKQPSIEALALEVEAKIHVVLQQERKLSCREQQNFIFSRSLLTFRNMFSEFGRTYVNTKIFK